MAASWVAGAAAAGLDASAGTRRGRHENVAFRQVREPSRDPHVALTDSKKDEQRGVKNIRTFFLVLQLYRTLCGPLQYNAAVQVFYNLQKTCRLFAAVVKKLVLRLCGLLQYNNFFVLCYCSCIVVVLHLCGPF